MHASADRQKDGQKDELGNLYLHKFVGAYESMFLSAPAAEQYGAPRLPSCAEHTTNTHTYIETFGLSYTAEPYSMLCQILNVFTLSKYLLLHSKSPLLLSTYLPATMPCDLKRRHIDYYTIKLCVYIILPNICDLNMLVRMVTKGSIFSTLPSVSPLVLLVMDNLTGHIPTLITHLNLNLLSGAINAISIVRDS